MNEKQMNEKLIQLAQKGANRPIDKEFEDRISTLEEAIIKEGPTEAKAERIAMKLAVKIADVQKGDKGDQGERGIEGKDGAPGEAGPPGASGEDGRDGKDGRDGRDGKDGQDGKDGNDGSPDTPDQVVEKVNSSSLLIKKERVEGLLDAVSRSIANASVGITTTNFFKSGALVGRAKNINFTGSAVSSVQIQGDQANVSLAGGSGGGQVNSVVAGTGISVDSSDAANPIVSLSFSFVISEVVSGSGTTFTLANTPVVNSVAVYGNGQRLTPGAGNDYTISGATITTANSFSANQILADYRK